MEEATEDDVEEDGNSISQIYTVLQAGLQVDKRHLSRAKIVRN